MLLVIDNVTYIERGKQGGPGCDGQYVEGSGLLWFLQSMKGLGRRRLGEVSEVLFRSASVSPPSA